jgi:hypothetical protein
MKTHQKSNANILYGPTVQYADGRTEGGTPLDIDKILSAFEWLGTEEKSSFLCIFAHDLTVAIRALLVDRPVPEDDIDRVWKINEIMHQLTSCADPRGDWTPRDAALMIRAIIDSSFKYGLDKWIGHALAIAAGCTIEAKNSVAVM